MVTELPFNRWGRLSAPVYCAGAYLLLAPDMSDRGKTQAPADAIRIWQRMTGVPDDDDRNWTTWVRCADLVEWIVKAEYVIDEWLPEGIEPDWQ